MKKWKETQTHHIIPKHVTGGIANNHPSNLVELTLLDHAIAYKVLYHFWKREQDNIAWKTMSGRISSEEARKLASCATITPELLKRRGRGISLAKTGKKYSKEYANLRKLGCVGLNVGEKNPMFGKKHTIQSRLKLSKNSIGRKWYTDGVSDKFSKMQPIGYKLGRAFKKRNKKS